MGKAEDQTLPLSVGAQTLPQHTGPRFCTCNWISRFLGFKCLLVLLLSLAVFLSALFWLPPFLHFADQGDSDPDSRFKGHEIVAMFKVKKPVSLLQENNLQLEKDIYDEIGFATTKVNILSLEPSIGSNITTVTFAIDPDSKYSKISPMAQSLIRAAFVSWVINQSSLGLTESLFGEPYLFQVLKFPEGITVIPPQSAFLLQKVQILFNFTLNFSVYQLQVNFDELRSQLKKGLHLAPYENLYVKLSNAKGSTITPPTTVQSSVLLTIGNNPSMPRLKQLAQTITGSHLKNLGLNNTVFGRVKQVRLSSILQHSLNGSDGTSAPIPSPSPAPSYHHHKHHHHHSHHHSHHSSPYISPKISPVPAPALTPIDYSPTPGKYPSAKPPGCHQPPNKKRSHGRSSNLSPSAAPTVYLSPSSEPIASPFPSASSPLHPLPLPTPAPSPAPITHSVPAFSPLPNVVLAHGQPPSKSESDPQHSSKIPSVSPSPSSSSAGSETVPWAILVILITTVLHL